jgi:predicted RNase H-like HicB family nuclease
MSEQSPMKLTIQMHIEGDAYWAEVHELPGCFAAGSTLDELFASLREGVSLYLQGRGTEDLASEAARLAADPADVRESLEIVDLMAKLSPGSP